MDLKRMYLLVDDKGNRKSLPFTPDGVDVYALAQSMGLKVIETSVITALRPEDVDTFRVSVTGTALQILNYGEQNI